MLRTERVLSVGTTLTLKLSSQLQLCGTTTKDDVRTGRKSQPHCKLVLLLQCALELRIEQRRARWTTVAKAKGNYGAKLRRDRKKGTHCRKKFELKFEFS